LVYIFFQKKLFYCLYNATFAALFKRIKIMKELEAIQFVQSQMLKQPEFPDFNTGDTIILTYRITEGDKTREQAYRGDVIQIKGHGATKTFTVRKMSHGVGVERIFAVTNPNIASIQVVKRGRVRRARLYYLRGLVGKKARIKELKRGV
jgi:large subunit ribosomal protein L19